MGSAKVLELASADREEALSRVLGVLDAGGVVVLPTETVYGVGGRADRPATLERLRKLKTGRGQDPFTLHIGSADEAFDRAHAPVQARRLARVYWPGPLTLVLDAKRPEENPLGVVSERGTLGFRVVADAFTSELLARCPAPLLLSSANPSGENAPTDLAGALALLGNEFDLAVDAGHCKVGKPSSVVHVDGGGRIHVLRESAVEKRRILIRAATLVLYVCTGNTCRSPMAEALARDTLARRLEIAPDRLIEAGLLIGSAGCSALPGMPASRNAVRAVAELGLDLTHHRSRALEPALLARTSFIYCMDRGHCATAEALLEEIGGPFEEDARPPELVAGNRDIADPIGGDLDVYRETRDEILAQIEQAGVLAIR